MLPYIKSKEDRRAVRFESSAMCQMPFTIRVTDYSEGQLTGATACNAISSVQSNLSALHTPESREKGEDDILS